MLAMDLNNATQPVIYSKFFIVSVKSSDNIAYRRMGRSGLNVFCGGLQGRRCLARSANTFQPRAHHIGQGSRAKWTRRTAIKFGMLLPSAIRRILAACSTSLSCAARSRLSDLD